MDATSHAIIDEVHKRRSVTKEFPPDVIEVAKMSVAWLESFQIPITVSRMRQTIVNQGTILHGSDGFIHAIWRYMGSRGDIESLMKAIGIEVEEQSNEHEATV